ncbi:MAG TPA: hypothetical protein VH297_04045 [Gaiellaceae bacterium]|jgi:hypothetical protein
MEGYEVVSSDESKIGQVAALQGDLVIVEGGLLRKSQHAVPTAFAHVDDADQVVRLSITKDIVHDSPPVEEGEVDRQAVAEHYGLAEGPPPDDVAESAELEGRRSGVEPTEQERARIREGRSEAGPHGRQIIPADPHEGP